MPRHRQNQEVQCAYFAWRLYQRNGVWYADGRSKAHPLGRHSLGTADVERARANLGELDRHQAEELGLAPKSQRNPATVTLLTLAAGRRLYNNHIARPRLTGGVKASTEKKYRSAFDKFMPWCEAQRLSTWNQLTPPLLNAYAEYLLDGGPRGRPYAEKTISTDLTTIKQSVKWLIEAGHLLDMEPLKLPMRKAESQRAYCWRPEEVAAMLDHCRANARLHWLGDVIVGLACTGLRISEFASLRWADIDLEKQMLSLTNDSEQAGQPAATARELKTVGSVRQFPIHPDFMQVLELRQVRGLHIFQGPRGGRLKPDTVRRILVRDVITPLLEKFPTVEGQRGFANGRLHSFRHYFCSTCANNSVPEQMLMSWLGHRDSDMVRHYYHIHDAEAHRRMNVIDFLGTASGGPAASKDAPEGSDAEEERSA